MAEDKIVEAMIPGKHKQKPTQKPVGNIFDSILNSGGYPSQKQLYEQEQARKQTEKTRDATLGDSLSAAVETASDDDLSKDGKAAAKDSEKIP